MRKLEVYRAEVEPLADPVLFEKAMDRVTERRKEKVLSLRHGESRCQSLGAGLLLGLALEQRGIPAAAKIAEGRWGKPFLKEYPDIRFNLSHAGKWALCALGDMPLGCDVERVGRGSEKLAARYFHPDEQALLRERGSEEDEKWQRTFTWIWTRKESCLKAEGTGLSSRMKEFSVLKDTVDTRYWDRMDEKGEYCFSLCVRGEETVQPQWRTIRIEELL